MYRAQYSADWGDYISFTHHMRKKADEKGVDLLVIDSGDRIEGNGLYDASDPKGKYTSAILREQSIDLLCTGNHELYKAESVAREHEVTVPDFKGRYLASNLDYVEPETGNRIPQAQRYAKLRTKNLGYTVVAFGFLFDFERGANNSAVTPVADAIKEDWFQQAIREKPDLFVVNGHVGLRMREFELVFQAIRDENWYTPIVFFGGHVHVRDARRFDDKAFAIASGRYMETIGWMSIDGVQKKSPVADGNGGGELAVIDSSGSSSSSNIKRKPGGSPSFKRRYIDNNLFNLQYHTGLANATAFATEHGRNVTAAIAEGRRALGLDHRFGCAPQDFWMTRAEYPGNASVFTWLEEQVLPSIVVNEARRDVPRLAILNTGAIRFDVFEGPFTRDSAFLVSPFTSGFAYVPDVSYPVASKVIQLLNKGGPVWQQRDVNVEGQGQEQQQLEMPDLRYLAIPEMMAPHNQPDADTTSSTSSSSDSSIAPAVIAGDAQKPLSGSSSGNSNGEEEPPLVNGYTTKDDLGDDGDDAVHSPIRFYNVPNCIQAEIAYPAEGEPERVDLVFNDYVRPWIIPALKFSGGDYNDEDIQAYVDGSFTELLAGWVKDHWAGEC